MYYNASYRWKEQNSTERGSTERGSTLEEAGTSVHYTYTGLIEASGQATR